GRDGPGGGRGEGALGRLRRGGGRRVGGAVEFRRGRGQAGIARAARPDLRTGFRDVVAGPVHDGGLAAAAAAARAGTAPAVAAAGRAGAGGRDGRGRRGGGAGRRVEGRGWGAWRGSGDRPEQGADRRGPGQGPDQPA